MTLSVEYVNADVRLKSRLAIFVVLEKTASVSKDAVVLALHQYIGNWKPMACSLTWSSTGLAFDENSNRIDLDLTTKHRRQYRDNLNDNGRCRIKKS